MHRTKKILLGLFLITTLAACSTIKSKFSGYEESQKNAQTAAPLVVPEDLHNLKTDSYYPLPSAPKKSPNKISSEKLILPPN